MLFQIVLKKDENEQKESPGFLKNNEGPTNLSLIIVYFQSGRQQYSNNLTWRLWDILVNHWADIDITLTDILVAAQLFFKWAIHG